MKKNSKMSKAGFGMVIILIGACLIFLLFKNEFCGPNNITGGTPVAEDLKKEIEKPKKNPYEGMVIHDSTKSTPYEPEESMKIWEQWYK